MTTPNVQEQAAKDTEDWTTGDEPITGPQKSYIQTLAQDADREVDNLDEMTKAEAGELIEELQEATGRS